MYSNRTKESEVKTVTREEKKKAIEKMAKKFIKIPEEDKAFINGYMTGKEEERLKWEQKGNTIVAVKLNRYARNIIWKVICAGIMVALLVMLFGSGWRLNKVLATDKGYLYIEQTENEDVIRYTEKIGSKYGICPELLQAIVFYESSNNPLVKNGNCIGYMQINKNYHKDRMDRLGVIDLTDGYNNILAGSDYLIELAEEYEDIPLVLMKYNGDSRADKLHKEGKMSNYAKNILDLSVKLERLHEK